MTVQEAAQSLNDQLTKIYKPGVMSVGHTVGLEPEEIVVYATSRLKKAFKTFAGTDLTTGEYEGYKVRWQFTGKIKPA